MWLAPVSRSRRLVAGATLGLVLMAGMLTRAQDARDPALEMATLQARIGPCSADFTVRDAKGQPIYAASIHVRVRYGLMGIKRADLEVGTNADGRARIEGLPDKARPLVYEVYKDDRRTTVQQDVARTCVVRFEVSLE